MSRGSGTRALLRIAPGEVWLTETGGILKFGRQFPRSTSRQVTLTIRSKPPGDECDDER